MRNSLIFSLAICLLAPGCGEVTGVNADADEGNPAASPTVAMVSPARGALAGGETITVSGTGFSADTRVIIGGFESSVTVDSDTSLSVTTPPGAAPNAPVDVVVFNGSGLAVDSDGFTYNPLPTFASIYPRYANLAGGATIAATGTGFQLDNPGTPTVTVGGVSATNVTVVADDRITFDVPAANAAELGVPKDVVITTANGEVMLSEVMIYTRPGFLVGLRGRDDQGTLGMYWVDPITGKSAMIADSTVFPFGIKRMAMNGAGQIYATTNYFGIPISLMRLDVANGNWEFIGRVQDTSERRTRGMDFVGGVLYAAGNDAHMGVINLANGIFAPINAANTLTMQQGGCVIARDAASVWFFTEMNQTLYSVAIATGVATAGPTLTGDASDFCHGAAMFQGTMYIIIEDRSPVCCGFTRLATVNTSTGAVTDVADLPRGAAGLVATPAGF